MIRFISRFDAVACMLAVGLFLSLAPAHAAEGRIPIFEPIFLDGTVSSIEGKYTLVRNISSNGSSTIRVLGTGSERVEINLNGFTSNRVDDGPSIFVQNVRSFIIRNGSVKSTGDLDPVVLITNASTSGEVIVDGLRVSGGGTGVRLTNVPNFRISGNIVSDSALHGIQVLGAESVMTVSGTITDNQIRAVNSFGIWVGNDFTSPEGIVIRGNRVDGAGTDGILIKFGRSFIIDSNTVTDAGNYGIKIQGASAGRLTGNTVTGCGTESAGGGIGVIPGPSPGVSDNTLISNNVSSNNLGFGIAIGGNGHRIQDNVLNDNGRGGMSLVGNDNTFGNNTARNNGGAPTCLTPAPGQCAAPDFCDNGTNNSSFGSNFMPAGC